MEGKSGISITPKWAMDKELFDKLVQSASLAIGHNVLVTDDRGYVLSCSDKSREGSLHEASVEVIRSGQKAYHDNNAARRLVGTLPGITIPLFMDSHVIGSVGITGSPQEISRYALLIQQMSQIFLTFQSQQQTTAQMNYRKNSLLREIVTFDKRTQPASVLNNSAYELGIDLNIQRMVILIQTFPKGQTALTAEGLELFNSQTAEKIDRLFHQAQDFICSQNGTEFVVLACLPEGGAHDQLEYVVQQCRRLEEEMTQEGHHVRIGIGSPADSLEGLRLSYENAYFAVRVMQTQVQKATCLSIQDVVLEKLAVSLSDEACQESESYLFQSILNAQNRDEILEVIGYWCRLRFNFSKTAEALHIHKSTLVYRFRRIQELTGLDLYDFDRVMAIYLLNIRRKLAIEADAPV